MRPIINARRQLAREFNSKCVYCETKLGHHNQGDIEFFRPRTGAKGMKKEFSGDHYWWLFYEWENIYFSCHQCNTAKGTWFPVNGDRCPIKTPYPEIREDILLIDPCHEDPAEHLIFDEVTAEVTSKTKKGSMTIELLKLNRTALLEHRKMVLLDFRLCCEPIERQFGVTRAKPAPTMQMFDRFGEFLRKIGQDETEYVGMLRYFIREKLKDNNKLGMLRSFLQSDDAELIRSATSEDFVKMLRPYVSRLKHLLEKMALVPDQVVPTLRRAEVSTFESFTIDRIEIKNFKSIKDMTLSFAPMVDEGTEKGKLKSQPWLMLLGENGVGKSSFLQATAIALMGEKYFQRNKDQFKVKDFTRHRASRGHVLVHKDAHSLPLGFDFSKRSATVKFNHSKPAGTFILAYGSTRLSHQKGFVPERTKSGVRMMNLFNPRVSLTDPEQWLLEVHRKAKRSKKSKDLFNTVALAFKDLLLLTEDERLYVKNKRVYVKYANRPADRLDQLSDGYKSVLSVAADIMRTAVEGGTSIETAQGIVFIDEVGTHLHPQWKMKVVRSIRSCFRSMQFIVTTHDPLCLKGLKAGEVRVFTRGEDGEVSVIDNLPSPSEFRAEKLLSSKFFGLNSTIDEQLNKDFNQYYYLLSKGDTLGAADKKKLNSLESKLKDKNHLGNSLREELALKAADQLLSEEKFNAKNTPHTQLQEQAKDLLKELWEKNITNRTVK